MNPPTNEARGMLALAVLIPLPLVGIYLFQAYTGLSKNKAFLALFGSALPGAIYVYRRSADAGAFQNSTRAEQLLYTIAAGLSFIFLTAFVLRLWGRWVEDRTSAEERLPGKAGLSAWFCASNIFVGLSIIVTTWAGFDLSPLLTATVVAALLAAYPLLRMETTALPQNSASASPPHELSAEREKILSMLEAGKLTPEESAELLQALGSTAAQPPPPRTILLTSHQRLVLIGAALVLLGFFLPWFVFNLGKEMNQMAHEMTSVMNQMSPLESPFGGRVQMPNLSFPADAIKTGGVSVSGGDIAKGLGWLTLLLALAAAVIPYLNAAIDAATARTTRLLCLGIGAIIVVYLLSQYARFVSFGFVMVLAGYVLEVIGTLRADSRAPAPHLASKPAHL